MNTVGTETNAGYRIVDSICFGDKRIVLGHNPQAPAPFVTWLAKGMESYDWGHYFSSEVHAKLDLLERGMSILPEQEKPHYYRLEIVQDTDAGSPRTENDNLGTMVCWHRKYNLGDKHHFQNICDFRQEININNSLVLPLYLYDHTILALSTEPFTGKAPHAAWDTSMVGYIYVTHEKIADEYGRVSQDTIEKAKQVLEAEVHEYHHYLRGDVYGFRILDGNKEIDSCWGFIGDLDDVKEVMKENASEEMRYLFDGPIQQEMEKELELEMG
jgi:hypothetical protein